MLTKLLGLIAGMALVADGLLAIFSPEKWRVYWREIAAYLPGGAAEYLDEVVQVTEKHRERSPGTVMGLFALRTVLGVMLVKLALRSRWR